SLFVANNTVSIYYDSNKEYVKNSFLFVGSLYRSKGIRYLLEAYKDAYMLDTKLPILNIIGEGDELEYINEYIDENGLQNNIFIRGAIYDDFILHDYFRSAYVTISPNQAGLSVLSSLGHGVPFVTYKKSITGGERFNIINGYNGFIYNDHSELKNILGDVNRCPEK